MASQSPGPTQCPRPLRSSALALLPAAPLEPASQAFLRAGENSWGLSVLPEADARDGLFHGFMTELQNNCSLAEYGTASRVLHVTAARPEGPWTAAGVALPAFAHNPQAVRDVDGAILLFHIGAQFPAGCGNVSCPGGKPVTNASCSYPSNSHGTSVARALLPEGPWERVNYVLPDNETNPSAIVRADGSILVTARRWTGSVKLYLSTTGWRGPYVALPASPLVLVPPAPPPAPPAPFDEDPYFFADARGGLHMLTHRQPLGESCSPTGEDGSDCRCAGGHLYAESAEGPWFVDTRPIFDCTLNVSGGNAVKLHARQRPTLLQRPGVCPLLLTGASTDAVSQYYSSFTLAQSVDCS